MPLTVRQFVEAGRGPLSLEVALGEEHLDRVIREEAINRPGLALTGFFRYFAHRRIQVFGLAEMTYLKDLEAPERERRLRPVFERHVPCVVVARHLNLPREMKPLAQEFGVPVLRTGLITGHFLQQAAVVIQDLVAPRVRVQGTMVDLMGIGVMIEGEPGVGKSETALGLLARGHSLVADDVTELRRTSADSLVGMAPEVTRYHMEIRGLGIIHVPSLFGIASVRREKRLDLIVRLERALPDALVERAGLEAQKREILGVSIAAVRIPVAPGRDTTHIVVVAALNHRLKQLGHDAAKELDARLMQLYSQVDKVGD